jgi:predicted DNA-binding helix-hairpin-helix protein
MRPRGEIKRGPTWLCQESLTNVLNYGRAMRLSRKASILNIKRNKKVGISVLKASTFITLESRTTKPTSEETKKYCFVILNAYDPAERAVILKL